MKGGKAALDANKYKEFALISKSNLSHNTRRFVFALDHPKMKLGLPVGQHISIRAKIDGADTLRSYTPTSSDDDLGYFELVVKVYPDGKITPWMDKLKIGDKISVNGPKGGFIYLGNGDFLKRSKGKYEPHHVKNIGMIAGGTGITPMYQIIQSVLKNKRDTTNVSLIFANVTEDDILLRSKLEELAENHPNFSLYFTLDKPGPDWKFGKGYVTVDMMRENLPDPDENSILLFCGPPPMISALEKNAEKMGYSSSKYFAF
jgi:NAD(P)H-flavin reductase